MKTLPKLTQTVRHIGMEYTGIVVEQIRPDQVVVLLDEDSGMPGKKVVAYFENLEPEGKIVNTFANLATSQPLGDWCNDRKSEIILDYDNLEEPYDAPEHE